MRLSTPNKRCGTLGMVILIALSLCSASCSTETDTSGAASQFAKEVTKEEYKLADWPSEPPVFRWDFSKPGVVHTYAFEQEVRNKTDIDSSFGGKPGDVGQEMSAKGALLVKSQGDGNAELVLKDMKMSLKMNIGGGEDLKTMEQTMPPFVVQGMKEDGSGSFGDSSQDTLVKMLFPLPTKPLKVGEFDDVPSQMPFNAMGSVLPVKGRLRITLTRYVKIGTRTCAQFDVDTDISDLQVPSELKGEYKCSTKGTSVFYFDVEDRSFVSGAIALILQFNVDAPLPQIKAAPDMPKRAKMSMTSDNLIRVKLKE